MPNCLIERGWILFRILIIIVLGLIALPAFGVSPRLAALAENGSMVEDVWADHLWPGIRFLQVENLLLQISETVSLTVRSGIQ